MTSIYELYETDHNLEVDGHWHTVNEKAKISFLLARSGGANLKFAKAMEKLTRPHRGHGGAFEDDKVDIELANELMQEAFAETIILDWKGVVDRAGKKIAFSQTAAVKMMKSLPDLFGELRDFSSKMANYQVAEIKEDVGN